MKPRSCPGIGAGLPPSLRAPKAPRPRLPVTKPPRSETQPRPARPGRVTKNATRPSASAGRATGPSSRRSCAPTPRSRPAGWATPGGAPSSARGPTRRPSTSSPRSWTTSCAGAWGRLAGRLAGWLAGWWVLLDYWGAAVRRRLRPGFMAGKAAPQTGGGSSSEQTVVGPSLRTEQNSYIMP